ncbi:MAG: DnaD domain protein, partial [Tissierellales bacterium]
VQLYQKCGFEVNGLTADWLLGLKEKYGFEWIKNALLEAERQGKRMKKYVEGILENWKRDGGMKLLTDNKQSAAKTSERSIKKNKFHNFEQRTSKYTAEELEEIARRKREEYYKKVVLGGNQDDK